MQARYAHEGGLFCKAQRGLTDRGSKAAALEPGQHGNISVMPGLLHMVHEHICAGRTFHVRLIYIWMSSLSANASIVSLIDVCCDDSEPLYSPRTAS